MSCSVCEVEVVVVAMAISHEALRLPDRLTAVARSPLPDGLDADGAARALLSESLGLSPLWVPFSCSFAETGPDRQRGPRRLVSFVYGCLFHKDMLKSVSDERKRARFAPTPAAGEGADPDYPLLVKAASRMSVHAALLEVEDYRV